MTPVKNIMTHRKQQKLKIRWCDANAISPFCCGFRHVTTPL